MLRRAAFLSLVAGALLAAPSAPAVPDVPGDPTPPVVTPLITGTLGSNGWYTTNVTLGWSVTDPESIILSTTGCDTTTLTADTTGQSRTCSAESDGGTTAVTKTFKIDKTAPQATGSTRSRLPDTNGWYNRALTVTYQGTDSTSGIDTCSQVDYSAPDKVGAAVSGTCKDKAGNQSAALTSASFNYDSTAPQATGSSRSRLPDANGWYNHALTITFQGSDTTSGIDTCSQVNYGTPDKSGATVTGNCKDKAGNQSGTVTSAAFNYDSTAPQATGSSRSRLPDANGWYNHALTVTYQGTDGTSGIDTCSQVDYSAPDKVGAAVSGSCKDKAGNQSAALTSASFNYDSTAPQASAAPSRVADKNGWYNDQLTVSFSAADALSGLGSCPAPQNYTGPDSVLAVVSGTCQDKAGNSATASFALKFDETAPVSVTGSGGRQPDANGWYNRALTVTFQATDPTSGVDACTQTTYKGPDDPSVAITGSCSDKAGNQSGSGSFALKYDATSPQITGSAPSRQPDANGWYNRPLTVAFSGTDATSQIAGCSSSSYAGPDSTAASLAGTCTDNAGNVAAAAFGFKYDDTAPTVYAVSKTLGNRTAHVTWRDSSDTQVVEVRRLPGHNGEDESVVYRGSENGFLDSGLAVGRKYEYRVAAIDAAANRAERAVDLVATGALLSPVPGGTVKAPPVLDWIPVKGASYYNLQIVRGRKVLSAWPAQSSFRLRRTWSYNGHRYRLRPGTYRWYVWPGFGRISASRYGRLLGSSTFVVRR
jgi:hypothetical protein